MLTDASVVLECVCHAQGTQVVHGTISNNSDYKCTTPAHICFCSICSAEPSLLVFTSKARYSGADRVQDMLEAQCGKDLLPPAEHASLRALDVDSSNPLVSHLQAMPHEQKLARLATASRADPVCSLHCDCSDILANQA